ncbi:MAG: hypothetical protein NVS4B3_08200 [Gemmatimonadaceae bacterium]
MRSLSLGTRRLTDAGQRIAMTTIARGDIARRRHVDPAERPRRVLSDEGVRILKGG